MKAPISNRVRRILANPSTAHDLVRQVIESRRTNHTAQIQVGQERFELVRVTGKSAASPDKDA
ncbi:MAG: hypothetical protein H7319_06485 [Spirosoma sp.]|nr:hypothetical protein [Spirosoma sp.]